MPYFLLGNFGGLASPGFVSSAGKLSLCIKRLVRTLLSSFVDILALSILPWARRCLLTGLFAGASHIEFGLWTVSVVGHATLRYMKTPHCQLLGEMTRWRGGGPTCNIFFGVVNNRFSGWRSYGHTLRLGLLLRSSFRPARNCVKKSNRDVE